MKRNTEIGSISFPSTFGEDLIGLDDYFLSKTYNQLGNVLEKRGEYAKAVAYYAKAEEVNPKDMVVKVNLLVGYFLAGHLHLARTIYNRHKDKSRFLFLVEKLDKDLVRSIIIS